jgi:spore germination protein PD
MSVMKMTVRNKKMNIDDIKIKLITASSLFLVGDTEILTSSTYFDTPSDSLIFSSQVPYIVRDKETNQVD